MPGAAESAVVPGSNRLLVVGYGNDLRGDDGAGRIVAERAAVWRLPGVRTISTHQLTPDHALDIAGADRVLFVDASISLTPDDVCILKRLPAAAREAVMSHHIEPAVVLAMARLFYDACPEAWLLTIPGSSFAVVDLLSLTGRRNSELALDLLRHWISENAG